jgi:hypothetical protein
MNMGKIVTLKWMKISVLNRRKNEVQTIQDFSDSMGILRAAEMQWFWKPPSAGGVCVIERR